MTTNARIILCKDMQKRRKKSRKTRNKSWIVQKLIPLIIAIRLLIEPINIKDFIQKDNTIKDRLNKISESVLI